jgi:hypothetical protein
MGDTVYFGGCLCGDLRYQVSGNADNLCYCHCQSCRRAAGAAMVAWGTFEAERFVVTKGRLAEYRSSPQVVRGFCAKCGTSITYRHDKRPAEIDVTLVTLDDPGVLEPVAHIWIEDKLPWIAIVDGKPKFRQYRPKGS